MAPQQNSTLIDENLENCPSMLNIPEAINRYSPILPPKNKKNLDKNNNKNNNYNKNINSNYRDGNSNPKWEFTKKEQYCYHDNKHYRNGSSRNGHSRRSRSISLCGANSTVEQGHTEITIWIKDEPRYVSGVTNKTTCNNIIKALIDDEINNGNYEYCQRLKDGTASRDYSDYVITECWRGIERSYDGNMTVLPVWKAWSRVHNEIRLSLKHNKDIQDPAKSLKTNTTLSHIRGYICKFLNFGKSKKRDMKQTKSIKFKKFKQGEEKENQPYNPILLFNPESNLKQKKCLKKTCSKNLENRIEPASEDREVQASDKTNKEKLYRLMESRSSVRKRRSSCRRKNKKFSHDGRRNCSSNGDTNNFLRKRKDSCIRSSVRNKLAQKNAEMNQLYEREYALTRQLTNKCKMYKLHNDLYTTCDQNLEMSVGQIQRNIEACAKEIIQTEHELLEVKNEIKNDISIINNLKRLTIDTEIKECDEAINTKNLVQPQPDIEPTPTATIEALTNNEPMQFVDNIYEFCDNNASMLV